MFSGTKHKDKKHHCMSCLQSFTTEEILSNKKKQRLLINGCQVVNYDPLDETQIDAVRRLM